MRVDGWKEEPGLPSTLPGSTDAAPVHSYFRREVGPLARAQLHLGQYSQLPRPTSHAALKGLRYEKKVLAFLLKRFGNRLVPGPLFTFSEYPNETKRAYPDALLFDFESRAACVLEVKFRHTGDAWWQLNRFYLPIVRAALPMFRICGLEVTASYDPSQRLPQKVAFLDSLESVFETREVFHPLHVLTERELKHDGCVA